MTRDALVPLQKARFFPGKNPSRDIPLFVLISLQYVEEKLD